MRPRRHRVDVAALLAYCAVAAMAVAIFALPALIAPAASTFSLANASACRDYESAFNAMTDAARAATTGHPNDGAFVTAWLQLPERLDAAYHEASGSVAHALAPASGLASGAKTSALAGAADRSFFANSLQIETACGLAGAPIALHGFGAAG